MATLKQFAGRMRRHGKRVEREAADLKSEVALVVDQNLVLSTPVDEGTARSNWVVSIGSPSLKTIQAYSPGNDLGIGEGANANAAIQQAQAALSSNVLNADIFISNNLPYIMKLNDGYSAQAPAGMIERAIQSGLRLIEKRRLLES